MPTFKEAGLPGFEMQQWYGILAPAGTPREIVNKISGEVARIVAMPKIKERLIAQGMDPYVVSPISSARS